MVSWCHRNNTMIPKFIHRYTFYIYIYIYKHYIKILNSILVFRLSALLLFAWVGLVKRTTCSTPVTVGGGNAPSWYADANDIATI